MRRIRYTLDAFTRGAPRTDIALFARVGIYFWEDAEISSTAIKKTNSLLDRERDVRLESDVGIYVCLSVIR